MTKRNRTTRIRGARTVQCQDGFGMIQALVMLAVLGSVLIIWNQMQVTRQMEETDNNAAAHAQLIQAGVNKYISDYKLALVNSASPAVPGFSAPLAPTMGQLQASPADNPYIPSGYNLANQLGMTYTVELVRLPAGCTPGVNCTDVTGTVTSVAALIDPTTNQADGSRVGGIANKIGLDAASSKIGAGTVLTGPAGTWPLANPRGNVPGILAMRVGFGSVEYNGLDHLLPRDGSRPMAGTLRLGGNPIADASTISATSHISTTAGDITSDTGSITTNSGSITTQSGDIKTETGRVRGDSFVPQTKAPNLACPDNGALASTANGMVLICRDGRWKTYNGSLAAKGSRCSVRGSLAETTTGEALICRGVIWAALAQTIGNYADIGRLAVTDGSVVSKPTCDPGGAPAFRFSMVQTAVDVTTAPPKQVAHLTASEGPGDAWTVSYKLRDDVGNETSANVYNLQAVMYTECKYQ